MRFSVLVKFLALSGAFRLRNTRLARRRQQVDGSSVGKKSSDPVAVFNSDVQKEMDRLETEIFEEAKKTSPVKKTAPEVRETQLNDVPSSTATTNAKDSYGDLLRSQISENERSAVASRHDSLQEDYNAKKQELDRQRNAILLKQNHLKMREAQQTEVSAEKRGKVAFFPAPARKSCDHAPRCVQY